MAIALFKHSHVSKATQPKAGRARDHYRYITRRDAVTRVFSERMPINWHAVQRFLLERESTIRKNGRVCDKFIVAVPREFNQEQAEKVLRAYGNRIGDNRTPFLVAFHWDEHNPHAHIMFIDADIETGRRVFGTSERNSTEGLKFHWAEEVNAQFQEMGLDTRIQFGTMTEELRNANENAQLDHPPAHADMVSEHLLLDELDNDLGRVDHAEEIDAARTLAMAEVDEFKFDYPRIEQEGLSDSARLKLAAECVQELERIKSVRASREGVYARHMAAQLALNTAKAEHEKATQRALQAAQEAAQRKAEYEQEHTGWLGKRGFSLKAIGIDYESPARRAANAASERAHWAGIEAQHASASIALSIEYERRMAMEYAATTAEINQIQGSEQELAEAQQLLADSVTEYTADLTPETLQELSGELTPEQTQALSQHLGYEQEQEH